MKRKDVDVDGVSDDLHDFSLSSQARKIRRLNAQLPPIMEEERENEILAAAGVTSPIDVVTVSDPVNEERAIVLYKPVNSSSVLHSPCNISVSLDSLHLVSGFKNQFPWISQSGQMKLVEDEEYLHNENNATNNKCLAVIPWVPSQSQITPPNPGMDNSQSEATESMEADYMEEETMDIEDNSNANVVQGHHAYEFGGMRGNESLNQWQQQYCMMPQVPQSTSTPITWFQ